MSNFGMLFERMESDKRHSKEEEKRMAIECIKDGLAIDENFWKNFIMLLNNPENLSKLLGISPVKITNWYSRIQKYLDEYLSNSDYDDIKMLKKRRSVDVSDYEEFI
jgi:hypothetical protein